MASQIFNVGIIGYGLSAKIYQIPFIRAAKGLSLYAVVQRTPKANDDAEKDWPGIKSFRSTEQLIADPGVDVVVVTTAPDSHLELARLALNAGKHVVVEKPFTPTYKEAQELVELAKMQNRLLTVYQSRRWDADFLTLSQVLKNKSLGRLVEYETRFERHVPGVPGSAWRTKAMPGGGAIYDLGAHLIDQTVQLFGLPKRITAFLGNQRDGINGSDDSFTVLMHYEGFLATAKAAVVSPQEKQLRFWVKGTQGTYIKHHFDVQEEHLKAGKRPGDDGYGVEPSERFGTLTQAQPDGTFESEAVPTVDAPLYTDFYDKLAKALAGEGNVPVDPSESAIIIRLIELAIQSSETGKTLDIDV
ncbi:hypothetical protein MYU51_012697 [Penicillium brevicompactum]|uniref:oxidoreductase n=1 Tax=Penicillium brevicompactum TaxID=5074 RepID=UPI002540495F|nr:oxidoreductase [Penicillium brevicompactum]KAJ5318863.1 oxidoreductase [Penicillium brevicompactum]